MKKLKISLIAPFLLLAFNLNSMSTLQDIVKPYVGVYECKIMSFGEEDILQKFNFVNLELKCDNKYLLKYEDAHSLKGEYSGDYSYDTRSNILTFSENAENRRYNKSVQVKNGEFDVKINCGGKLLFVKFQLK